MSIRIVKWSPRSRSKAVSEFMERPAFNPRAERSAAVALSDVEKRGDRAVRDYAESFDGVKLEPSDFAVCRKEIDAARKQVDPNFKKAVAEAVRRVKLFSSNGLRPDWEIKTRRGGTLGEVFRPLDRVGVYVPGGAAPLASTAVMTVAIAATAGVKEIVACTPARNRRELDPFLLYALDRSGATEIYRVGGIASIGMMAYGTDTVKKVQKIVGPGGDYVTAAKRQVYGYVALDLVAGPSEIVVLCDESANPVHAAADLLSQAEHGTGSERAMLITTSGELARKTAAEVERQAGMLSRKKAIRKVMKRGMLAVVVGSLDDGIELCNRVAPEHLELMVRRPRQSLKKVTCAGAVFLGKWTPESAGDFVAGPSHVLPTGGSAAMFSGLTVDDFRRRLSVVSFTKSDLKDVLPVINAFGRVEGLDGHSASARVRFE